MDPKQIAARVVGRLIAQPQYTYADTRLIADVVRETVNEINALLCDELEECVISYAGDRMAATDVEVRR